jgi:HD superfamily phosphohydrolase
MAFRKIINDPVYGFITIDDKLIHQVISHPYYQRLRRISQMALAQLVYPGAVHSRLHHSLGAYHLMGCALQELISKGVEISPEEQQAAKIAILLHDIGHGPYSHALEHQLAKGKHHEELSLMIFKYLNNEFGGMLDMAMDIFTGKYHKKFLHQLISGQLDVDRMDYLTRDSFFTGVSEGVIGYDRILKMLTIHQGELMVEEKGIYSIEKFLVARRLMYWQVYLHKTVLTAEQMLRRIISRAIFIKAPCPEPLSKLLHEEEEQITLQAFCKIDDSDIMTAIKSWAENDDKVLSILCKGIINRQLLRVRYFPHMVPEKLLKEKAMELSLQLGISDSDAGWLCFAGEASSRTYDFEDESIKILFKDGSIRDISEVDNALINEKLKGKVRKYYFCYYSENS